MQQLNAIAQERSQSLAQMAIAWVLRHPGMTSALIGASKVSQVEDCVGALDNLVLEFGEKRLFHDRTRIRCSYGLQGFGIC